MTGPFPHADAGSAKHRGWVGPAGYYDRIGALQFAILVLLGMREHHLLLDIGCGSLRGGRLSLVYLNEGRYHGIEPERQILEDGVAYEVSDGLVALKKPRFSTNSDFSAKHFGVDFDFVLASGIFMHAAPAQVAQCFGAVAETLSEDGLFVGAFLPSEADEVKDSWTYPEVQRYTPATLERIAVDHGLRLQAMEWPHTFNHRWFVACHRHSRRPVPQHLDLSVFSWSQYLRDQVSARGGADLSHEEYLKADLRDRLAPGDRDSVLPQVFL
ncbi:class I SAM-dependent methyltransferase [Micromonospora sp. CA-246542]|uniref:class I SAM-dependent methyltransferase n=1 Tax=Micromonospora sp. CA-246542 TaxID=3239959 RepID=UPI003D90CE85